MIFLNIDLGIDLNQCGKVNIITDLFAYHQYSSYLRRCN